MVERIGNNRVFRAEQSLKQAAVGVKAGGVKNGVFHAEEVGQFLFKLLVAVLGAADKAHRGHAEAVAVHAGLRSGDKIGVVSQAKVVVGAEVDDAAAVTDHDIRLLRGGNNAFLFKQPFRPGGVEIAVQLLVKITTHCNSPDSAKFGTSYPMPRLCTR